MEDKDHHKVEAKMRHHAIKDHIEMLKKITPKQIEEVVRGNDKQIGLVK